jgi:cyclic pyranopterin phosphate synthase
MTADALPVLNDALTDRFRRRIRYLRVSVTDRCNYRCAYCMPAEGWAKVPRDDVLSLEELATIIGVFADLGVERVRLTGGEPLVRRDLDRLVAAVAAHPGVREVALTTNGHLLERQAEPLWAAGLRGLNVSVDTLDPERFARITRGGDLGQVLRGIEAAKSAGFRGIKVNAVAVRGFNDHELADLAEHCWRTDVVPRFIELMPIGDLGFQGPEHVLPTAEILGLLARRFPLAPDERPGDVVRGPARYHVVTEGPWAGRKVGLISPMTDDGFCATCNRARLTARGGLRACLANDDEVSVLQAVRSGAPRDALVELITQAVQGKLVAHRMRDPAIVTRSGMTGIGG